MTDRELRTHIGSLLRSSRERHRLTQSALAARVATSQATVARIERGDRAPSLDLLRQLFAVLGYQMRLRLEPLEREVDEAIAALAAVPMADRIARSGIPEFSEDLAAVQHVFIGASAALLQGAPVPAKAMEIALARCDCDAFTRWLQERFGARWHRQYREYGYLPIDPRQPGELRWRIIRNVLIRAELGDALPPSLEVQHGDRSFRVVPLPEVEIQDPEAARLLRRYRDRLPGSGAGRVVDTGLAA